MLVQFFNSSGNEFQTSEALTEKALSPSVLYLAVFFTIRLELFDLSDLDGIYLVISSDIYDGERLFKHL